MGKFLPEVEKYIVEDSTFIRNDPILFGHNVDLKNVIFTNAETNALTIACRFKTVGQESEDCVNEINVMIDCNI